MPSGPQQPTDTDYSTTPLPSWQAPIVAVQEEEDGFGEVSAAWETTTISIPPTVDEAPLNLLYRRYRHPSLAWVEAVVVAEVPPQYPQQGVAIGWLPISLLRR